MLVLVVENRYLLSSDLKWEESEYSSIAFCHDSRTSHDSTMSSIPLTNLPNVFVCDLSYCRVKANRCNEISFALCNWKYIYPPPPLFLRLSSNWLFIWPAIIVCRWYFKLNSTIYFTDSTQFSNYCCCLNCESKPCVTCIGCLIAHIKHMHH